MGSPQLKISEISNEVITGVLTSRVIYDSNYDTEVSS